MKCRTIAAGCLSMNLLAGYACADPAACAAVDAANSKLTQTSFHTVTVDTGSPAGTRQTESIVTGGFRYLLMDGHSTKLPYSPSDTRLASNTPTVTCTAAGSEPVGTEAAAVYTVHNATEIGTSDTRFWISTSRGLPLRSLIVITAAGLPKHQMDIRYDYENIRAPS